MTDIAQLGIQVNTSDVRRATTDLDRMGGAATRATKSIGSLALAFAGGLGISKLVEDTATIQDLTTRMRGLTKEAGDYGQTIEYLNQVAGAHHKVITDLTDGYAKLRNLQNGGIITGNQTKAMFEGLSNAASALGASNAQLNQVLFGLAQGLASPILKAEELNQIIDPLPGLLLEMDKAAGLASGGFRRLTLDQKVTSEMLANTLVKALKTFDGASAATAQNINAKNADMRNSWLQLVKSIEPTTRRLYNSVAESITDAFNATRRFNESAIMVGKTNISASNLAAGAWDYFVSITSARFDVLAANGGSAMANFVVDNSLSASEAARVWEDYAGHTLGLFIGLGKAIGDIMAGAVENISVSVHNAKELARVGAKNALNEIITMGSFGAISPGLEAANLLPTQNAVSVAFNDLIEAANADYGSKLRKGVSEAAKAHQDLADKQKASALEAEQLTAKQLQAANAHNKVAAAIDDGGKAAKKAAGDHNRLQQEFERTIQSLEREIALMGVDSKAAEMAYETTRGAMAALNAEQKKRLELLAGEFDAAQKAQEVKESEKSELEQLTDRYNQLTLSARAYYETQLAAKGITGAQAAPLLAQFDKNTGAELAKKQADEAAQAVKSYADQLGNAAVKTADLQAVTSSFTDNSLKGFSQISGVFSSMVEAINQNTSALEENRKMQSLNEKTADPVLKAANFKKFAEEEKRLTERNSQIALSSVRQFAGASAQMFGENTKARKTLHTLEMTFAAAEMAQNIAGLASKGASAILTQGSGDPYTAFARIAAMTAIVGGIIAAAGGSFNSGGGSSVPPALTSDKGTVLGDSEKSSESINSVYELLQDIHASEYAELRGINQGVANLKQSTSDTITRLFQAGGLSEYTGNIALGSKPVLPGPDPITTAINNIIFGKKTTSISGAGIQTEAAKLADVMSGIAIDALQYTVIETKKKSLLFGTKTSYQTVTSALDDKTTEALQDVFTSAGETMTGLAQKLGGDLQQRVNDYVIPAMRVELKGLSGEDAAKKLSGVIGAELDRMSESVFGDMLGKYQQLGEGMLETTTRVVAQMAIVRDSLNLTSTHFTGDIIEVSDAIVRATGGLKEYQKAFDSFYEKFYTDAEKQSRLAGKLYTQLSGLFTDYEIGQLAAGRVAYRNIIAGLDTSNEKYAEQYALLIKLSEQADTWYKAQEAAAKALADIMNGLYKSQKDDVSALVTKYDDLYAKADGYAATVGQLMNIVNAGLSEATDTINNKLLANLKDFASFSNSVASARTSIASNIGALGMTGADIAPGFYQDLIDSLYNQLAKTTVASEKVSVINSLNAAIKGRYDAELSMLGKVSDTVKQIRTYLDSLKTGALSPLTNAQKLAESGAQFQRQLTAARAGDKDALSGITTKADEYLKQAQGFYASSADYIAIFNSVSSALEALALPKGMDEATYKALTSQYQQQAVSELQSLDYRLQDIYQAEKIAADNRTNALLASMDNINATVDRVATALNAPKTAFSDWAAQSLGRALNDFENQWVSSRFSVLRPGQAATPEMWQTAQNYIDGSHADGLNYVPFDGYVAELHRGERVLTADEVIGGQATSAELIAEIKALRAEVAALRKDTNAQTGAVIQSNYDANARASDKVVGGISNLERTAWKQKIKPEVV